MEDHKGHRERLKERFLKTGFEGFSSHEILELLLFYSIPRENTNPISHRLLQRFGSLSGVFEAPFEELKAVEGVGKNSATLLKLIPCVARAYEEDKNKVGIVLTDTRTIANYIMPKFIGKNNEHLLILCLDQKGKLLSEGFVAEGTIDTVAVNIREIVKMALSVSACMIIMAHNHTQGFAIPSGADFHATEMLMQALKPLGIKVYDHIIVARDDCVSLKDSGFFAMK